MPPDSDWILSSEDEYANPEASTKDHGDSNTSDAEGTLSEPKGFAKAKMDRHRNKPLIATICLCFIGYRRNKNANLLQIVNGYFAFAQNIPKRCLEVFHQMGLIVSGETVCHFL